MRVASDPPAAHDDGCLAVAAQAAAQQLSRRGRAKLQKKIATGTATATDTWNDMAGKVGYHGELGVHVRHIRRPVVEGLHALLERQQPQVDVHGLSHALPEFESQRELLLGARSAIRP
jgi:hypothetical protein